MPLMQSNSKQAVSENIKREMQSGKPQKQAIAIAMAVRRRNHKAHGGMVQNEPQEHLSHKAQSHETLAHPQEPTESLHPRAVAYQHMARGGIMSPHHIVSGIMKRKMMSKGGMAGNEIDEFEGHELDDDGDVFLTEDMPEEFDDAFNTGSEHMSDGGMLDDHESHQMKRKKLLSSIFSKAGGSDY